MIDRGLLDYVLVSKGVFEGLIEVNVYRGVVTGVSDHFLVEGKLRVSRNWKWNPKVTIR